MKPVSCMWKLVSQDAAMWETECEDAFWFLDGFISDRPTGNGMKFCCYCGRPLVESVPGDATGEP